MQLCKSAASVNEVTDFQVSCSCVFCCLQVHQQCVTKVEEKEPGNSTVLLPSTPSFDPCVKTSSSHADYNAQMSACAKSSYCVLFDTPSSRSM